MKNIKTNTVVSNSAILTEMVKEDDNLSIKDIARCIGEWTGGSREASEAREASIKTLLASNGHSAGMDNVEVIEHLTAIADIVARPISADQAVLFIRYTETTVGRLDSLIYGRFDETDVVSRKEGDGILLHLNKADRMGIEVEIEDFDPKSRVIAKAIIQAEKERVGDMDSYRWGDLRGNGECLAHKAASEEGASEQVAKEAAHLVAFAGLVAVKIPDSTSSTDYFYIETPEGRRMKYLLSPVFGEVRSEIFTVSQLKLLGLRVNK